MSIISQHLADILKQKDILLWSGYVNMLKTLESVFVSPKHWVLEFLQNAEDASSKKISIRLGQDLLCIFNDGNVFSDDDFYSICDVNSRKLPSLGFRGYIGIGFKSIFRITDCIHIHSGNFHFKFDKSYWDDSTKREGIPMSQWPWEILPIEVDPVELPEDYKTGFFVPLKGARSLGIIEEMQKFLASPDFPKESILLLKNVEVIEVQVPDLTFTITKKTIEAEDLSIGKKEQVIVSKETNGRASEEAYYMVFRKTVIVPDEIKKDDETERVRRSDVHEREIGLVFGLDEEKKPKILSGKLSGVYSFLPVEGEQTGLPFGIFGDFIPQPGRDLINYGAKWNLWMCNEVINFFKEVVENVFAPHPDLCPFISDILDRLQWSSVSGPGEKFWGTMREQIKTFIELGDFYLDADGKRHKLSELVDVKDEIVQIIGKELLENTLNKKIVSPSIKNKIRSKIGGNVDIYEVLHQKELLEPLRNSPEKLCKLYCQISKSSVYYIRFVLGEDGEFYPPSQIVFFKIDVSTIPNFLKETCPKDKKPIHPEIAKNTEAVAHLERCGMEVVDGQTLMQNLETLIARITTPQQCPSSWRYPYDLIEATLFLISQPNASYNSIKKLIASDGTLHATQNLFAPQAPLDWTPLWNANLLHGFQPIHEKYYDKDLWSRYHITHEQINTFLNNVGVHGFENKKDKELIEKAAIEIAKKKLSDEGHIIASVEERDRLGYDLQCDHCKKVFEVKGMGEPHDVILPESEVIAAQQKKDEYILIFVYNLPANPDEVGYKEVPNPERIWQPIEKVIIPKDKWFGK